MDTSSTDKDVVKDHGLVVAWDDGEQSQENNFSTSPSSTDSSPAEQGLPPPLIPFALFCFHVEGANLCKMDLEEQD